MSSERGRGNPVSSRLRSPLDLIVKLVTRPVLRQASRFLTVKSSSKVSPSTYRRFGSSELLFKAMVSFIVQMLWVLLVKILI